LRLRRYGPREHRQGSDRDQQTKGRGQWHSESPGIARTGKIGVASVRRNGIVAACKQTHDRRNKDGIFKGVPSAHGLVPRF